MAEISSSSLGNRVIPTAEDDGLGTVLENCEYTPEFPACSDFSWDCLIGGRGSGSVTAYLTVSVTGGMANRDISESGGVCPLPSRLPRYNTL